MIGTAGIHGSTARSLFLFNSREVSECFLFCVGVLGLVGTSSSLTSERHEQGVPELVSKKQYLPFRGDRRLQGLGSPKTCRSMRIYELSTARCATTQRAHSLSSFRINQSHSMISKVTSRRLRGRFIAHICARVGAFDHPPVMRRDFWNHRHSKWRDSPSRRRRGSSRASGWVSTNEKGGCWIHLLPSLEYQ